MALRGFTIAKLLEMHKENDPDTLVQILFGNGVPGGDTGEEDDAPIGSTYMQLDSPFNSYRKIADANSTADWDAQLFVSDAPELDVTTQITGVTTITELDNCIVDDFESCKWELVASLDSAPAQKQKQTLEATHDGTSSADATATDHTVYSKLKMGATFDLNYTIALSGVGAAQKMSVSVTAAAAVSVIARRIGVPSTP